MHNSASRFQSRREFLRVGSLAPLGWATHSLLANHQLLASSTVAPIARRCILVWLDGGPSHIDTFDPKPNAASEVRGPFAAIPTAIPGIAISELLPQMAARLDRCCLIRSLSSELGEHNLGTQYMLTGYAPSPVIEHPTWTSVLQQQMATSPKVSSTNQLVSPSALPASVAIPRFQAGGSTFNPTGFLDAQFGPFSVNSDPAKDDFAVTGLQLPATLTDDRLSRRHEYLKRANGSTSNDPLTDRAFDILASDAAKRAFDLSQESPSTRDRYGRKTIGQSCLLARRLIEHGVSLVTVIDHGWDTHDNVVTRLRDGYTGAKVPVGLVPSLDQALAALLDDLQHSGLLTETLIVVMGEFGRTPKWNVAGGRDHWPRVFSALLAGGPVKPGVIIGSSDRNGESPLDEPVSPADLTKTIYRAMGCDLETVLQTSDGRPIQIAATSARVIEAALR